MKINIRHLTLIGAFTSLFTSCGLPSPGPQAWLDLPLDNTTAPLAPLTIMSHASDTDGVARFVFYVDGEEIKSIDAEGERLESRQFEWNPPRPGTYVIEVRAFDGSGNPGSLTSALVMIGDNLQFTDILTPYIDEVEDENTETPTLTPTSTPTQTLQPPVLVQPSATPVIDIIPPAPLDTTPPSIYGSATDKDSVCATYSSLHSNVVAWDEGGISRVYATWSLRDINNTVVQNGYVGYTPLASPAGAYTGVFGPFDYMGTLSISGTVEDNATNTASFSHTVSITLC